MTKITPYQASFTSGELSPKLWGRIDLDQYYSAGAEVLNFGILPYGPLTRRNGTEFIAAAKSTAVRLISFTYSITQSVIIELGDHYARFYYMGGQIVTTGNVPYEIATPWSAAEVPALRFAQSGDILFYAHKNYAPGKLSRYGWTDWRIEGITFTAQPAEWGLGNYPQQVCFMDQRLIYASTPRESQKIWASRTGQFTDFTLKTVITSGSTTETDVLDTDGIAYTISTSDLNPITWLVPIDILAIGTMSSECKAAASALNESFTPSNFRVTPQTNYGSADLPAYSLGSGVIFIQRTSNRVRLFDYQYLNNKWEAVDLTIMADHVCAAGVTDLAVTMVKDTIFWVVLSDGRLAGFTYEKQQKVNAWHRHKIAGGQVKAIAAIPSTGSDEVWLIVQRTINGASVKYVERLAPTMPDVFNPENAAFLDSHKIYSGAATTSIPGLSHLEGKTVGVLVDGWVHPDVVVTGGAITLQKAGSKVCVGLKFLSRFVSMEIESQQNLTKGLNKRLYKADISLYNSLGAKVGSIPGSVTDFSSAKLEEIFFGPTDVMDKACPLFTGIKRVNVSGNNSEDVRLVVQTDYPLPMTLRGVKYHMEVKDE